MNGEGHPPGDLRPVTRAKWNTGRCGLERLGDSDNFGSEVERLATLAPEPWRSQLLALIRPSDLKRAS